MTIATDLTAALERLAPPGVRVGTLDVDASHIDTLTRAERALAATAVPSRQAQLATGRVLLRHLAGTTDEILRRANGAPALPDDVVGTLAHDHRVAVAALAPTSVVASLGIDLEPIDTALTADEAAVICRPEEADLDPRLVFVLKEAAYKAWSTPGAPVLGHHDVSVTASDGTFAATVRTDGSLLEGRWTTAAHRHLALVVVPA
jgi:4'-phosphopantetheinyl transferase EntD